MAKFTIAWLLVSSIVLLIAFGKGIGIIHGGDVMSHLQWSVAGLFTALGANLFSMFHAAQADRLVRELRAELERAGRSID